MEFLKKLKLKSQEKVDAVKSYINKIKADGSKRKILSLVIILVLLISIVSIYIIVRENVDPNVLYGLPHDQCILSKKSKVHKKSPLYLGILSYQRGYLTKAIANFEKALQGKLHQSERVVALNYIGDLYTRFSNMKNAVLFFQKSLQVNSKNPAAHYGLGLVYYRLHAYHKALGYFKKSVEIDDEFLKSYYMIAISYEKFKDLKSAMKYYRKYLDVKNDDYIRYRLGVTTLNQGASLDASLIFKEITEKSTNSLIIAYAQARLADISDNSGSKQKGLDYYKRAVINAPENYNFLFNYGVLLLKNGVFDKAVAVFEKVVGFSKFKSDKKLFKTLGEIYYDNRNWSKAIYYLQSSALKENDLEAATLVGDIFYMKNDFIKAIKFYRLVIKNAPGSTLARSATINIGNILFQMNDFDKSLKFYRLAENWDANDPALQYNIGSVLWQLGETSASVNTFLKAYAMNKSNPNPLLAASGQLISKGKYRQALNIFLNEIAKKSDEILFYIKAANLFGQLKEYDNAKRYYKMAAMRATNSKDYLRIYLGLVLVARSENKLRLALTLLKKAQRYDLANSSIYYSKGAIFLKQMDIKSAISNFETALKYKHSAKLLDEIYFGLGNCYYKKKEFKIALDYYKRILNVNPSHFGASFNATKCVNKLTAKESF